MPILMHHENDKCKAVTLSYDDGVYQDIRLSGIFNKNGLKATFFVNCGCFLSEDAVRTSPSGKLKLSEAMEIHKGHEVASHTVTHTFWHLFPPAMSLPKLRRTNVQSSGSSAESFAAMPTRTEV